jgi:hypothetical protein
VSASKLISEERLVRLSELVNSGDRLPVWGEARDLIAAARLAHELERVHVEADAVRRERNRTAASVLGGEVEGQPTSPHNWIQRARALVEKERAHAYLRDAAEELLHLILQHDIDREGDVLGADLGERVRAFLDAANGGEGGR